MQAHLKFASLFINTTLLWVVFSFANRKLKVSFKSVGFTIFIFYAALVWLGFSSILYVLSPSYFSYIETHMANVTLYWINGHAMYPAPDHYERYALLYGPWPFVASSLFLWPKLFVIPASKMMGWVNLAVIFGCFGFLTKRLKLSAFERLACWTFFVLTLLSFDNYSYVNRPDSYLMTYTFLAFTLLYKSHRRGWLFYTLVGLLGGLCVASKIHGFFYFVPLFAVCLADKRSRASSEVLLWLYSAVVGGVVCAVIVSLRGISMSNYYFWLNAISEHGLQFKLFTDNTTFVLPYFIALSLCGFFKLKPWETGGLIVSSLAAAIFGSLTGAGTHHLLPLLPLFIFWSAESYAKANPDRRQKSKILLVALLGALTYESFISQKAMAKYLLTIPGQAKQFEDLKALREGLGVGPVELGYSGHLQLEMSYFKPYFVARGDTLLVEVNSLMDGSASHIPIPQETLQILNSCKIPFMILPKDGDPWSIMSGFGTPVFTPQWKSAFQQSYTSSKESAFYKAFSCHLVAH